MVDKTTNIKRERTLTKQELVELGKIKHSVVIRDLTVTWVIILLSVLVALWQPYLPVIVVACLVIGSMQNTLILWTHEASHYHLSRNKKRNDNIGDLIAAGPVGITVGQYRWEHIPHHLHLGDPEHDANPLVWMCLRGGHLFSQLFRQITGIHMLYLIRRRLLGDGYPNNIIAKGTQPPYPRRSPASLIGFFVSNLLIFALCLIAGRWYLYPILWWFSFFGIAMLLNNMRSIVEHQPSSDVCDTGMVQIPANTRIVMSNWLERNLMAGVGFYYHYEHHAFPALPYHRLGEARRMLEERGHFEDPENPFMMSDVGYIRTLWRLAMTPGYGVRILNPFFDPDGDEHHGPVTAAEQGAD